MELSQFKGAAEIGAVVRHIGSTLTTGERLLPADASTVNPATFPRLAAMMKTNVRTLAASTTIRGPLLTVPAAAGTVFRFAATDLPNNYMLGSLQNVSAGNGFSIITEFTGGTLTRRNFNGASWGVGRPSFSQNRQKKVIAMSNGEGRMYALTGVSGEGVNSLTLRDVENVIGDVVTWPIPSLMRADGSNCLIFCSTTQGTTLLNVYSSPLSSASGPWTRTQRTITGGSNNLTGEAYGNATLSTVVLGVKDGSLLRSTDSAASFTRIFPNPADTASHLRGFAAHPDTATALCRQGDTLLITSDGWNTSRLVPPFPVPEDSTGVFLLSAGIEDGSRNIFALYSVALPSGQTLVLLRSTDHGATWSDPIIFPRMSVNAFDYGSTPLIIPANPTFLYAVNGNGDMHRIDFSTGLILPYLEGHKVIADRA